ncbi:MAG: MFS transporter [Candidatus Pacearchaeota archaeon]
MNEKESEFVKELKHKSRRRSIKEGIFASGKTALGEYYLAPFAIAINTSNFIVALLGSISGLLGPLSQIFSSRLLEKYSRKRIIMKFVFLEALMWLPIILIAFLFYAGILTESLPFIFLVVYAVYVIFMNISSPPWFSWMGDIVDKNYRGRWFSKRHIITSFVSGTLAIVASFFLEYTKGKGWLMIGYIILFTLALLFRLMSWKTFQRQYEPKIKLKKGYYFTFWDFIINSPKTNFGKFTIYRTLFSFATAISSPLVAIYLLRNLGFGYTTYIAISLAEGMFALAVIQLWGNFADKYGNYRVLCISSILIPLIPILWIFSPNPIYLFFVPAIIGGVAWAGFNLAAGNFVYDNISVEKRGLVISYYNMLIGIGTFLGAGIGAFLIKYLTTSIEPIIIIFILSAVARAIFAIWWVPKIKEIRKTEKFGGKKALRNLIFKEAKPILTEEAHEILSIHRYIME